MLEKTRPRHDVLTKVRAKETLSSRWPSPRAAQNRKPNIGAALTMDDKAKFEIAELLKGGANRHSR